MRILQSSNTFLHLSFSTYRLKERVRLCFLGKHTSKVSAYVVRRKTLELISLGRWNTKLLAAASKEAEEKNRFVCKMDGGSARHGEWAIAMLKS